MDMIYTALIGKPSELTMAHADAVAQKQAKLIGLDTSIKRIYFVGDNLNTDIFGANLYNRYLKRHRTGCSSNGIAAVIAGRGSHTTQLDIDEDESYPCAEVSQHIGSDRCFQCIVGR